MRIDEKILLGVEVDLKVDSDWKKLINIIYKKYIDVEDFSELEILFNYLNDYILKEDNCFLNKVYNYLEKLKYDNKIVPELIAFFDNLIINIEKKIESNYTKSINAFLTKTVYTLKDLNVLEYYLKEIIKGFDTSKVKERKFFEHLLLGCNNLSLEEEKDYYYEVIKLFLRYNVQNEIRNNYDHYCKFIENEEKEFNKRIVHLLKNDMSLNEVINRYKVRISFSMESLVEAEKLKIDKNGRLNLLDEYAISIDDEGNKCFDDAFSIKDNEDGTYTLAIYISDVASLVDRNSKVIKDAKINGETIYLWGDNILMFPLEISHDKASLIQKQVRNVIAFIVKVDNEYNILEDTLNIKRACIRVRKNLSFKEADKNLIENDENVCDNLLKLLKISYRLKNKNPKLAEYRQIENKTVKDISSSPSNEIVHELMVLTNYLAAKFFYDKELPYIRRVFSYPKDEEVKKIVDLLIYTTRDNIYLEKNLTNYIKGSYGKPKYSTELISHEGNGYEHYSHSTSPIRRYSDIVNQYLMYDLYFNERKISDKEKYITEEELNELCKYLNNRSEELSYFAPQYNYVMELKRKK